MTETVYSRNASQVSLNPSPLVMLVAGRETSGLVMGRTHSRCVHRRNVSLPCARRGSPGGVSTEVRRAAAYGKIRSDFAGGTPGVPAVPASCWQIPIVFCSCIQYIVLVVFSIFCFLLYFQYVVLTGCALLLHSVVFSIVFTSSASSAIVYGGEADFNRALERGLLVSSLTSIRRSSPTAAAQRLARPTVFVFSSARRFRLFLFFASKLPNIAGIRTFLGVYSGLIKKSRTARVRLNIIALLLLLCLLASGNRTMMMMATMASTLKQRFTIYVLFFISVISRFRVVKRSRKKALKPDLVINAGTAGGFKKHGTAIGDVFISTRVKNHDRR